MTKDYNRFIFTGRLGRDPEERQAGSAKVATFSVACNRMAKGETVTDWFNVTAWDKTAELALTYLRKGSRVQIEGSVQLRKYTDKDGNNREATEIVARDFMMLDSKPTAQAAPQADNDDTLPF